VAWRLNCRFAGWLGYRAARPQRPTEGHPGAAQTRLSDPVPLHPAARAAGPWRCCQGPRDPGAPSPADRAAPPDPTTQVRTCRPRGARRHQPRLAPGPLVVLPRQAGDAAALAPAAGRRRLDLPAPRHRATATGPGAAAADRPPGHREPALGLPAHQGRAAPARHPGLGNRDPHHAGAVMDWTRRHDRRPRPGGRSCASRRPASWPATSSPSTPSACGGCMCCSSSNWPLAGSTWPA
jgi:hypothetical protein